MINNVVIVGRAGKAPELKTFSSGAQVASLSMAIKRPTKEDETDWIDVKIWGKSAEIAQKYIKKGDLFGVEGRLHQETWEQEGQKRSKLIVAANNVRLMQPKAEGAEASKSSPSKESKSSNPYDSDNVDLDSIFASEDEIPF